MLKVNIILFFLIRVQKYSVEDSKKDAEVLQILRRALQTYCRFSKWEEATIVMAKVPTYEDEEETLLWMLDMPYALHSGVKQEGLIPVYVIAPYGLEVGRG